MFMKIRRDPDLFITSSFQSLSGLVPAGFDGSEYLIQLGKEGLRHRYGIEDVDRPLNSFEEGVRERFYYEAAVIIRYNLIAGFVIMADLVAWVKDRHIPLGPGYGSTPGSFFAYLLGITSIDPLRYNLLFEGFFSPESKTMPVFDIEIASGCRHKILGYAYAKYAQGGFVANKTTVGGEISLDSLILVYFEENDAVVHYSRYGQCADIEQANYDDPKIFTLLHAGEIDGSTHADDEQLCAILSLIKPNNLEQLAAVFALFRKGVDEQMSLYAVRKNGEEIAVFDHPLLEPVLKHTYGIFLYQEQFWKAAQVLAGFPLGQGDFDQRIVSKEVVCPISYQREQFIKGCQTASNIKGARAESLFNQLEKVAPYLVSRSHMISRAMLIYQDVQQSISI